VRHNILYVFDNLEFGGGERAFAQIVNRLSGTKYKIMVACLPTGAFIEKIKGSGAQIKSVDMRNRFNLGVILQLSSLIKSEKIDIVHSQGVRADFFARIASKLASVSSTISTVQMPVGGFDVSLVKKLVYMALNRFSECFVDRFVVTSDTLEKTMIEKHGIASQRIVKIYNGVEVDEYCMADEEMVCRRLRFRKESGLGDKVPIIGVIGRLVWQKGFECFIEAIPEVLNKFKHARFLIVGEGVLKDELEARCKKLKLADNIIFTGFRSDIKDILASIDIFVMPSLLEGLPMILLEAMAMAKPIVATDIDGIKEVLVDGEAGLLVPPRNKEALSGTIINLLVNKDKSYQMGMAARKIVKEKFGVDVMVQKVEKVYEELLPLKAGVMKAWS
jgi:glycosyltransferase involved in cell wall biosynthesis